MSWIAKIARILGITTKKDWDASYISGETPWDSGRPSEELKKVLSEDGIKPGLALELGCGTGTNLIYLARQGFHVVGVEYSGEALKRAEKQIGSLPDQEAERLKIDLVQAELPAFSLSRQFDFIFDRGCFHTFPAKERTAYASMVYQLLAPGGHYLLLTGNAREPRSPGPPVLTEDEIRNCFERDFELLRIRDFRFQLVFGDAAEGKKGDSGEDGALGHSCLIRRQNSES